MKTLFDRWWVVPSILTLVIFSLYAQTLSYGLIYFDDQALIVENFPLISNFANIPLAFRSDVFFSVEPAYYRPLLTLSFMADAQLAGNHQNLAIFHLGNLILHLLSVLALFYFFKKIGFSKQHSFGVSLVFAVHPALTQAIAWIPGRNDSLFTLSALVSLIFLIKYLHKRTFTLLLAHAVFFLTALLTKETAVLLPVLFSAMILLTSKNTLSFEHKWVIGMSWLLSFSVWLLLRSLAIPLGQSSSFSSLQALLVNGPALLQYLGKSVFPLNLAVVPLVRDTSYVYGLVTLGFLGALTYKLRLYKNSYFLLGLLWFVVTLVPSLAAHNPSSQWGDDFQLEHRLYFPLVGLAISVLEIWKTLPKNTRWRSFTSSFFAVILLTYAALSFQHSQYFSDQLAFWEQATRTSPSSPLAHRNLGAMYYMAGRLDEAERSYLQALELHPQEPMVHNNLGLIAQYRGDTQQALEYYQQEISINPQFGKAYLNYGSLLLKFGNTDEAREHLKTAAVLLPRDAMPIFHLAKSYEEVDTLKHEEYVHILERSGLRYSELLPNESNEIE